MLPGQTLQRFTNDEQLQQQICSSSRVFYQSLCAPGLVLSASPREATHGWKQPCRSEKIDFLSSGSWSPRMALDKREKLQAEIQELWRLAGAERQIGGNIVMIVFPNGKSG